MHPAAEAVLSTLAAYLCGSVPFGFIVARTRGIDIRAHGSGNIGATNVGRVLGNRWGVLVLACDLCKGLAPVAGVGWALRGAPQEVDLQVLVGAAAIAGHMYPVWLKFRGGKGVATALGVVLCLAPQASLIAAAVFALIFGLWRIVSLAALVAAVGFGICQLAWFLPQPFSKDQASLTAFSLFVPLWIVVRHHENIRRLVRGEEPRFRAARTKAPPAP